jgi:hypothetical protein
MGLTCMPELLKDDTIARCCFTAVSLTFSKMLAPETEANLTLEIERNPSGLPRLHFEGFVHGTIDCGLSQHPGKEHQSPGRPRLPSSVRRTLRSFYNNGSELTLKRFTRLAANRWSSQSTFSPDARLRLCSYTTTTQIIVGLSQLAFAAVGEANTTTHSHTKWDTADFRETMSDQALVKLSYERAADAALDVRLESTLSTSKRVKQCRFVRFGLKGDLRGTMDCMLSPRVPIKSSKYAAQG